MLAHITVQNELFSMVYVEVCATCLVFEKMNLKVTI